ncbi:hypothetical protein ACRQFL_09360, partial [Actinotignum sp. GS-2025b]
MGAVFLDTCVLFPALLREALLETAYLGVYRVSWSNRIEEELTGAISRSNKERGIDDSTTSAYLSHLFKRMHHAFPGGSIELPPGSIGNYGDAPDPNDRGCGLFIGHYRLKPLDDAPQSLNHR